MYLEKEKPVLDEMTDHVVPKWATSWKELGMQLSIDEQLLQNIAKDNAHDCKECCSKMLNEWLDMNTNASWGILINALDKLTMDKTADNNDDDG